MFRIRAWATAGGAIVTLLLAAGMWFSIRGLDEIAATQMAHLRAEEEEITQAERLRWNGELIVSLGRGYLISRDAALLTRLLRVRTDFDEGVHTLTNGSTAAESTQVLLARVRDNANRFVEVQEELATARQQTDDPAGLVRRFEQELLPLQRQLGLSLDRLVEYKEATLIQIYSEAARERAQLSAWLYLLLGLLVLLGTAVTAYFASQVARAYRQAEDALSVATRAVAARDEIMGIVAHDLRNPLYAISIKARLLQRLTGSEEATTQAGSILRLTMSMEHLIRMLLDTATIEGGRFSVDPQPCAIGALIRAAVELVAPQLPARNLRLIEDVPLGDLQVQADRERVLQVLSNLLGNAVKFSPEHSDITLAVARDDDAVRFSVTDTGPGLAREQLPHVFDRFWKDERQAQKGTGLGLFIARSIIEAHGGRIWVESAPGAGATFSFTLPCAGYGRSRTVAREVDTDGPGGGSSFSSRESA